MKDLTKEAEAYYKNSDYPLPHIDGTIAIYERDLFECIASFAQSPEVFEHLLDSKHDGEKIVGEIPERLFYKPKDSQQNWGDYLSSRPTLRQTIKKVEELEKSEESAFNSMYNEQGKNLDYLAEIAQLKAENEKLRSIAIDYNLKEQEEAGSLHPSVADANSFIEELLKGEG